MAPNSRKDFALAEAARAAGFRLVVFETIGSTNDAALAHAGESGADRIWFVAKAQTSGRGRHGRQWQSPPGNLYASLLLADAVPFRAAPLLGFVAGVALAKALRPLVADAARLQVKWPNDILFDGAKLAGILVEGREVPGGGTAAVIGFGVNCEFAPPDLPYKAVALAQTGAKAFSPADVFSALSGEMAHWLDVFRLGFDAIRLEWLSLVAGLGSPIKVATAGRQFAGTFRTIDATGRLVLEDADGTHIIEAGDVLFGH